MPPRKIHGGAEDPIPAKNVTKPLLFMRKIHGVDIAVFNHKYVL